MFQRDLTPIVFTKMFRQFHFLIFLELLLKGDVARVANNRPFILGSEHALFRKSGCVILNEGELVFTNSSHAGT